MKQIYSGPECRPQLAALENQKQKDRRPSAEDMRRRQAQGPQARHAAAANTKPLAATQQHIASVNSCAESGQAGKGRMFSFVRLLASIGRHELAPTKSDWLWTALAFALTYAVLITGRFSGWL